MSRAELNYITDIEQLRKIQLGALDALVEFCEAHDLTYYMTGGTLLGAVRHQGFIPWDDDVDIVMPRPDYENLLRISEGELSPHHRIMSFEKDANHCRLYYRVVDTRTGYQDAYYGKKYESSMGIDVFPVDGVPENEARQQQYFAAIKKYRKGFIYSVSAPGRGTNLIKAVCKTLRMVPCKIRGSHYYYKKITAITKQYTYEQSNTVALAVGYYNRKEVLKKDQYGAPVMLPFEGREYAAPADYKQYLTNLYGDYMALPPKEQRVAHHNFIVWYK